MTQKRKLQLLDEYNNIDNQISELQERYAEVYTQAVKITPTMRSEEGHVSVFNTDSKVERAMIKLEGIENKIKKLVARKQYVENELNKLHYKQRMLVIYIDVYGMSIKRASTLLKIDYRSATYIHARALERIFNKNLVTNCNDTPQTRIKSTPNTSSSLVTPINKKAP